MRAPAGRARSGRVRPAGTPRFWSRRTARRARWRPLSFRNGSSACWTWCPARTPSWSPPSRAAWTSAELAARVLALPLPGGRPGRRGAGRDSRRSTTGRPGRGGPADRAVRRRGGGPARGRRVRGGLAGLLPRLRVPDRARPGAGRRAPAGRAAAAGAGGRGGHRGRAGRRVPEHVTGRLAAARAHLGGHVGPAAGPACPAGPGHAGALPRGRHASPRRPSTPASGPPALAPSPPGLVIEVVRPGPLATVQDLGRPGFGHLGVPRSGAADAASLRRANRLVGQPGRRGGHRADPGPGRVPIPGRGPGGGHRSAALRSRARRAGRGPRGSARPPRSASRPGGLVQVGAPAAGLRSYLAVRGGIDVPPVLGSRSADLRSGLGPAPLRPATCCRWVPPGPAAPGRARGAPAMPAAGGARRAEGDPRPA